MTVKDARKFVNDLNGDAYESFMAFIEEHPKVKQVEYAKNALNIDDETQEHDFVSKDWDSVILAWLGQRHNLEV
jgi:hypothetical protein